jgi:hypothetical protein
MKGPGQQVEAPGLHPPDPMWAFFFSGTRDAEGNTISPHCVRANASVVVNGDAVDTTLDGWTFGFIQVEWIETNRAEYHGEKNEDGSALLRLDRPPFRRELACRDTPDDNTGNQLFYDWQFVNFPAPVKVTFPHTIRVDGWNDSPQHYYPLQVFNTKRRKWNFLHEVQIEFHFLTVFSALSPTRVITHLAHFFWYLHWQVRFQPPSFVDRTNLVTPADFANAALQWPFTLVDGKKGNNFEVSPTFRGAPVARTHREQAMVRLLDPKVHTAQSCNAIGNAPLPPLREELVWVDF